MSDKLQFVVVPADVKKTSVCLIDKLKFVGLSKGNELERALQFFVQIDELSCLLKLEVLIEYFGGSR